MKDLVIDTNVLVQASNPESKYKSDCEEFLSVLRDSESLICVDKSLDKNVSLVLHEYDENLNFGMVGFATLAVFASTQRLKFVPLIVSRAFSQRLLRLVPNNQRDRTFVKVAANSMEHLLVSHDFRDFPENVRTSIRKKLEVIIRTAGEVTPDLLVNE